ncbi:MAG: hypothetical protein FWG55_02905, partial [Candidatus Bathyarchaeota archaeon]|nr:hypothetical protein [Candidatus Termiticorpusculum sp.]
MKGKAFKSLLSLLLVLVLVVGCFAAMPLASIQAVSAGEPSSSATLDVKMNGNGANAKLEITVNDKMTSISNWKNNSKDTYNVEDNAGNSYAVIV